MPKLDLPLCRFLHETHTKRSDFARTVGVSPGRITQICNGDRPSLALASAIVKATNGIVQFNDLIPAQPKHHAAEDRS